MENWLRKIPCLAYLGQKPEAGCEGGSSAGEQGENPWVFQRGGEGEVSEWAYIWGTWMTGKNGQRPGEIGLLERELALSLLSPPKLVSSRKPWTEVRNILVETYVRAEFELSMVQAQNDKLVFG